MVVETNSSSNISLVVTINVHDCLRYLSIFPFFLGDNAPKIIIFCIMSKNMFNPLNLVT